VQLHDQSDRAHRTLDVGLVDDHGHDRIYLYVVRLGIIELAEPQLGDRANGNWFVHRDPYSVLRTFG